MYNRIDSITAKEVFSLNCADNINVEIYENNEVKIIVTRSLSFDPEELFQLSVAFGAGLKFDPQKVNDFNWNEINLAEEFRETGKFVT